MWLNNLLLQQKQEVNNKLKFKWLLSPLIVLKKIINSHLLKKIPKKQKVLNKPLKKNMSRFWSNSFS